MSARSRPPPTAPPHRPTSPPLLRAAEEPLAVQQRHAARAAVARPEGSRRDRRAGRGRGRGGQREEPREEHVGRFPPGK